MLIKIVIVKGLGNIHSHCLRLVAIDYEYSTVCHDNGNVGLHVCAMLHDHTYTVLYAHSKDNIMYVVIARCWLLLVMSMVCCHDNGNVGLHIMCAEFHYHTYTLLYAHSKGIR